MGRRRAAAMIGAAAEVGCCRTMVGGCRSATPPPPRNSQVRGPFATPPDFMVADSTHWLHRIGDVARGPYDWERA